MRFDREKNFFLRSEQSVLCSRFGNATAPCESTVRALKIIALCSYVLMLAMQIRNIVVFQGSPTSDAARYVGDAFSNLEAGTWYPTERDFVGGGVAGTGLVNYFIFLLRIVPDTKILYVGNLLLVQLMLFSTVYIAKQITQSDTVGYITASIFCFTGTYWAEVCVARTEIFFTALAFFALALAVRGSTPCVILSGAVLAYAQWARPLAIAFIVSIVWLFIRRADKFTSYVKLFSGFFAVVLALTAFTYVNSGRAIYSPTIADGNFLMGAHEDADGSYENTVFNEGKAGYIPPEERAEMTVEEINAVYKKAATDWIKANPVKYLSLMPKKLFYFLATDTYSGDIYFDNKIQTAGRNYIQSLMNIITGSGSRELEFGDIAIMYTQAFYMVVLALFLAGVLHSMKNGYWRTMSFLYGIFLIGVASVLYTVGGGRYHFPYLPVMIITAAVFTDTVFVRKRKKFK